MILVTLMVATSQVLSTPIDDITHVDSYMAIAPSVPIRIDPTTITQAFNDQSPYSESSNPFKDGFYYTVPARLILYQPPSGQSYDVGRAADKERSYWDHRNPVTVGEYVQGSQQQYKDFNDQEIPARSNAPELMYANYQVPQSNQASVYRHTNPTYFSGRSYHSGDQLDEQPYNPLFQDEVQDTSERFQDPSHRANKLLQRAYSPYAQQQYSQMAPVSYESNQGMAIDSQSHDQQGAPTTNSMPNSRLQFYEESNPQQYGSPSYRDGSSESIYKQYRLGSALGPEPQSFPTNPFESPSEPNYHSDIIKESNHIRLPISESGVPLSPQIPPSYLVGAKILTNAPSSTSAQGRPVWDRPGFPKHTVEPWDFDEMYGERAHSGGRSIGFQSNPVDSSRPAVRDPTSKGFRPPPYGYLSETKARAPWVLLMVHPDSLLRKDYNGEMKSPLLSTAGDQDDFPRRKGNLNVAESHISPQGKATDTEKAPANHLEQPATENWESIPVLGQATIQQESPEIASSLDSHFSTNLQPQYEHRLTQERQLPTIETSEYIPPSAGGARQLIGQTGKDQIISSESGSKATPARKSNPRDTFQTMTEEVIINGSSRHGITSDSQHVAGQSTDNRYADIGRTESARGNLQAERLIMGGNAVEKISTSANSGQHETEEPGTGTRASNSNSNTETAVVENVDTQRIDKHMNSIGSTVTTEASLGSAHNDNAGMAEQSPSSVVGQQVTNVGDGPGTATNALSEGPSTSRIVQYDTPEGVARENLQEGNMMTTEGSVAVRHQVGSGRPAMQEEQGGQTLISVAREGSSPSQGATYLTEGSTGMNSQLKNGQRSLTVPHKNLGKASLALSTGETPAAQRIIQQSPDTTRTQVEEGVLSSQVVGISGSSAQATKLTEGQENHPNGASSETIHHVSSGRTEGENLDENKIARQNNGGYSVVTRYLPSGGPSGQQIIEEGNTPQTISTLADGSDSNAHLGEEVNDHGSRTTILGGTPSKTIRYITTVETTAENISESPKTVVRYINSEGTETTQNPNSLKAVTTIIQRAPMMKTIRYIIDGGEVQEGSNVEFGSAYPTELFSTGGIGGASNSTITTMRRAPITKIIRYITTANGEERQEVIDSNQGLENDGLPLRAHGRHSSITQNVETNPVPASTSKVIRYTSTAGGVGQEGHANSSHIIENEVPRAAEETGQGNVQSTTLENGSTGTRIVQYLNAGDMGIDQHHGKPTTVTRIIKTGGAGTQQVIEEDGAPDSPMTFVDGARTIYKTIRYVSNDGVKTQQVEDPSKTIQPAQTITRYITMPSTDAASDGQTKLQQGGRVTRYITVPGGDSSQYLSGLRNIQSTGNMPGGHTTVTRYVHYPPQSGGMHYIQPKTH